MARPRNTLTVVWMQIKERDGGLVRPRLRWIEDDRETSRLLDWMTPDEAEHERAMLEARVRAGISTMRSPAVSPTVYTVRSAIVEYGRSVAEGGGGEGYKRNVVNRSVPLVAHLGAFDVTELRTAHLTKYTQTRRHERGGRALTRTKAPTKETGSLPRKATVRDELRLLRRACLYARSLGRHRADFPPMPKMKDWPDDASPPRKVSDAEMGALVEAASDRPPLARLLTFMAHCPRRPVAIFALTRADCRRALDGAYTENDLLWFSRDKGGVNRGWSPLLPRARAALLAHLGDTIGPPGDLVWRTATGLEYDARRLGSALRYLSVKAKVDLVTPYDLRKYAAVKAYRATGRSLKATCRFTGHKDAAVLLRHYLFDEEEAVSMAVRGDG